MENQILNISKTREGENSFMGKVYSWMFIALLVTGFTSYFMLSSPDLLFSVATSPIFYLLIFGELGLVIFFSARINKLSLTTATLVFMIYSVLNGITISVILLQYTSTVVYNAFLASAVTFGAMSGYGYFTKKDLTSWGGFFMMGLIGIIIGSVINIFMASSTLHWLITYIGIFVFLGLTAYDTQKIKSYYLQSDDSDTLGKLALFGALALYLDFINLFLMILRVFGRGDD
ncbi:MAG: hypothetical protein CR982_01725 [Candidatus Cloacimonadota bacterium]|nr:MAG: hypothetical protein CR982_01725 [Candidatus Cloacimonadota bacterium]PIE78152.1 MAG: hypothetical protein CSA15_09305 [Candidatus Delongbacteria bacterium]